MNGRRAGALMAALAMACATPQTSQRAGSTSMNEIIFVGGVVVAGADQKPQTNWAVYAAGETIREVGPAERIRAAHPRVTVVDAGDSTILPGLIDAHGHLYGLGLALDTVDLVDTTSYEEVIARVKARAEATPKGDWVTGRGWDQNDWPVREFPTKEALDAAVPDHPVWLRRIDGHAGLANSAALRAAGVTRTTADPSGGRIVRDASGEPTGVFIDEAMDLVDRRVPPPSFELRKARVLQAAQQIARMGLTEMHDAGADDETLRAVRELIDEGRFPIRVYAMLSDSGRPLDDPASAPLRRWLERGPFDHGGRLSVRSIKVYADGALGSRGAALLEPYSDDPPNRGLMIAPPEHIERRAREAIAAGFQVNTHAIGDRGVRNVLDAYDRAGVGPEHRFRVEHFQVAAPADIVRAARNGVIASMQPTHATSDMDWAEARVGPERIRGAYAWRSVLANGGRLALGSDFPVESVNPLFGIHAAVTRQNRKGWPEAGWYPEQRLTLAEAIRGFTLDAAYAAFEERSRGTIEPGKLADLTIVKGNLFAMPARDLHEAEVKYTVVGGVPVHGR